MHDVGGARRLVGSLRARSLRLLVRAAGLAVLAAAAFPSAAERPSAGTAAADARPDWVLITVDTLRADHLGAYGYPRETSPNIDALAEEGLLFETAVAPMPMTLPSHVSLLTSALPARHGVLSNFRYLQIPFAPGDESGLQSAAQILAEAGYATAAFTSASPLSSGTGVDAGFTHFDGPGMVAPSGESQRRRARETVDRALAWLETAPSPFFLWVHVFDPHMPYEPPPPHDTAFAGDGLLEARLEEAGIPAVLRRHAAHVTDLYDGEIRYTDEQLGRLFEALRARGTWDDGVVTFTADHGEGLLEHGETGHRYLWRTTVGIPLILRLPGGPRGVRSARIASLLDVLPTLAAHTALPLGDASRFDGSDLLDAALDDGAAALAQEAVARAAPRLRTYALRTPEWKLWHRPDAPPRLYRPSEDPHELRELAAEHPEVVARMRARIEALLEAARERPGAVVSEDIDPELRRRLIELGYAE